MKKKSYPLVDSELLGFVERYPGEMLSRDNLADWRASRITSIPACPSDSATELSIHRTNVAKGGSPPTNVLVYRPVELDASAACILHLHGGGFVAGSAAEMEAVDRDLCRKLKCVVASVDYRLAPETCFPGNVEDCYSGLLWLFESADNFGIDRARVGVMGASAGGGLAAAVSLLVRDRGEISLAFQHLNCPMLDDRTCASNDPNRYAGEFVWTRQNNEFGWSSLLGGRPGQDDVSAYAAPARAVTLQGLPPTFISTGALDLFVDENLQYAHRLLRAGVPTELHVYPGGVHGFDLHPTARIARIARENSLAALARFTAAP